MLDRVISGGQTGADQAGWRAAKAAGLPTGGWMPKEFLTEDGPRPEFAELYGAAELDSEDYVRRTRANVHDSSATLRFGDLRSPGSIATHQACLAHGRSVYDVVEGRDRPSDVVAWLGTNGFKVLNVAGNRESTSPGIGERVERIVTAVFRQLERG
jgi:hypothetical protein